MPISLEIDPNSPVPLYHQIAEALRSAIEAGELAPGEALEPMRRAADAWGVHLHTVRHAYAALARDGLIELRRGRGGTRVLGATATLVPTRAFQTPAQPEHEAFLDRVAKEALERHGLTAAELAAAFTERAERRPALVYVVECSEWQCRCHAGEIQARFHVDARIWPLDRRATPAPGAIVSTYFHYNDIRRLWPQRLRDVHFLTIYPDPGLREELAGARRLIVVERDPATAEAVAADLTALFSGQPVEVEPRVVSDVARLTLGREGNAPTIFPPRLWAELPLEVQQDPRALELRYVLDPAELAQTARALGWAPKSHAAA
jgi:DNA-binding transcriptional regulator YhcF (GntR family)